MHKVTIQTVAEKAQVSKATVSHVINNTRFVTEETRQRVLHVIDELGYRPSLIARSLTTNRTGSIGVIVSDISNAFFGDLIRGIEDFAGPKNYSLMVCNTDEILERESHYLDLLLGQRVDGLIVAAASQRWQALTTAEMQHTPIVYTDRKFEGLRGPYAGADNVGGARLGTEHLIQRGYRKIGILAGFQRLSSMRERLAGFQEAMRAHGLPVCEEYIAASRLDIEEGRAAARKILSLPEPPEALFISNNYLSLGALRAIQDLGLTCPGDVAIIGFDDHPWSAVSCPPLSVVRQPSRRMGQVAAEMLETLINGASPDPLLVELPCELVLRSSC